MIKIVVLEKPAPDFEGKVTKGRLSEYRGKPVLVCFYSGDLTMPVRRKLPG